MNKFVSLTILFSLLICSQAFVEQDTCCGDGEWWDDSNSACANCASRCSECDYDGSADDDECVCAVDTNCDEDECADDSTCTGCNDGYYLSSNACVECPDNCVTCSSDSDCGEDCDQYQTDDDGNYVNYSGTLCDTATITWCENGKIAFDDGEGVIACQDPTTAIDNCETYSTTSGFVPTTDESNVICGVCSDGYTTSDDWLTCETECDSDQILESDVCEDCPSNCDVCSSSSVCTDCADSYGLISDACVECTDANCENCDDGEDVCQDCNDGYGLVDGECNECTATNCLECDTTVSTCTECASGYGLGDGECYACATNCAACTGSCIQLCTECTDTANMDLDDDCNCTDSALVIEDGLCVADADAEDDAEDDCGDGETCPDDEDISAINIRSSLCFLIALFTLLVIS